MWYLGCCIWRFGSEIGTNETLKIQEWILYRMLWTWLCFSSLQCPPVCIQWICLSGFQPDDITNLHNQATNLQVWTNLFCLACIFFFTIFCSIPFVNTVGFKDTQNCTGLIFWRKAVIGGHNAEHIEKCGLMECIWPGLSNMLWFIRFQFPRRPCHHQKHFSVLYRFFFYTMTSKMSAVIYSGRRKPFLYGTQMICSYLEGIHLIRRKCYNITLGIKSCHLAVLYTTFHWQCDREIALQ